MNHYGVRRLVAVNSGNYEWADIDVSKPVHLAAPNNRGKSTLVNALQFLYIDLFEKMTFGRRSHDDSKRHYFGQDRSYLVFECLTMTGVQCLLVRGLSNLRGANFERYVYDGEFHDEDYLDGQDIRDFSSIQTRLADRHLVRVKNSDLWQTLAGNLPANDGKPIPRLNILPIRRREEYVAFRDVFVRLLSLKNADAKGLRRLVIESHARDVGEQKIDVAADYKDGFERASRSEQQVKFIRAVASEIDNGRQHRQTIRALSETFAAAATVAWNDVLRCRALIATEEDRQSADVERLKHELADSRAKRDSLLTERGTLQERRNIIRREWQELADAHERWSAYSPEFIQGMRGNFDGKCLEIAELDRHLDQGTKLDIDAMRREVSRLTQQLAMDRTALERWEQTTAAELRRVGVSESEIDSAFRVANPALLKLIVGETAAIKDQNTMLQRIRLLADGVQAGKYIDASIELDVSGLEGPAAECDPQQLQSQITFREGELSQKRRRLQVAENEAKARETLLRLKQDRADLDKQLAEYDRHMQAWQSRAMLDQRLKDAESAVADLEKELEGVAGRTDSQTEELNRSAQELDSIAEHKRSLDGAAKGLREAATRLGFDSYLSITDQEGGEEAMRPKQISRFVESVARKLLELTDRLYQIGENRTRLKKLQDVIADKSRQFEGQQRYFSDEDTEWTLLIETHELLPQLEEATKKTWDALFTTLGARFNAIVAGVSSIKIAIERINKGLKAYRVSNLRTVEIKPDVVNDTYSAVEALSSQGSLFQDHDAIDHAKKRLLQMIEHNDVIELESLFELRIRIEEADGTWHQAPSLDEIGSTGTGMTAKAMIFIQLMRAIAANEQFRLHFYIDGLGELDDRNLDATAAMAVSKGIVPITADPRLHLEPLAQPEVTVYTLGQNDQGRFFIDQCKTYHARRQAQAAGATL
jgi:hypothetical protein